MGQLFYKSSSFYPITAQLHTGGDDYEFTAFPLAFKIGAQMGLFKQEGLPKVKGCGKVVA